MIRPPTINVDPRTGVASDPRHRSIVRQLHDALVSGDVDRATRLVTILSTRLLATVAARRLEPGLDVAKAIAEAMEPDGNGD